MSAGTAPVCAEVPYTMPSSLLKPTPLTQDLRSYFERPRIVESGTLPTNAVLHSSRDINLTTLSAAFPGFQARLAGVYGIRFTARMRLQVSNTPFHQGVYVISFQYSTFSGSNQIYNRSEESATCTNLPHVRLNLTEGDSCTLDVPFLSPNEYMSLKGDYSGLNYGVFAMNSILPTPSLPSTPAPTYKLFLSLHDMELLGATSWVDNSIVLLSGIPGTVKRVPSKKPPADKELEHTGALSSALSTISEGFATMSGVPAIGSLAGTPAWLAASLSKTAAAFGYSSPSVEARIEKKYDNQTLDPTHIDMPIPSSKLSNFQTNKLAISEAMGACEDDQMSFNYVLSKPSQIFRGAITTGDSSGTVVYATKISPMNFWFRSTGTGNIPMPFSSSLTTNALIPSTLMYVSDSFRYWRGGLKFDVTLSKTAFHGGMAIFSFIPYSENGSVNVISNTTRIPEIAGGMPQVNQFSMLVDFRSGEKFSFHVPFMHENPFAGVNDSTGAFSITMLNPLTVSSSEASTSIGFLVEVSALPDFEFSCPLPPSFATVQDSTDFVILQSGLEEPSNASVASAAIPVPIVEPSSNTMGEKFHSLKQLAMIPYWYRIAYIANGLTEVPIPYWSFKPRFDMAVPMSTTASAELAFSQCGKVADLYTFSNGATRFTYQTEGTGFPLYFMAAYKANPGNIATASYTGFANPRNKRLYQNGGTVLVTSRGNTIEVPWFSKVQRVPHNQVNNELTPRRFSINTTPTLASYLTHSVPFLQCKNGTANTHVLRCAYSASEDATAVAFIGPPPVILFNSLATTDPNGSLFEIEN